MVFGSDHTYVASSISLDAIYIYIYIIIECLLDFNTAKSYLLPFDNIPYPLNFRVLGDIIVKEIEKQGGA